MVTPPPIRSPRHHHVDANGLRHHVLEWGGETGAGTAPTVVLIHGYMDAAGSWDLVAEPLAQGGLRVLAPDMRGFGQGPRAGGGAAYHFPDYVADVAALLEILTPDAGPPPVVVGHSMGGSVATYYAGAFPERVGRLVLLEGLGPPSMPLDVAPDRVRSWIRDTRQTLAKEPRLMAESDAFRRLALNHPGVAPEILRSRMPYLVEELPGGLRWRADPIHRVTSPSVFTAAYHRTFAARVTCPVLSVSGGPEGFHPPDEDERFRAFVDARAAVLPGAGHMMHWTRPAEVAALVLDFARAS